jgi:multidrug resistance efflux pump
MQSMVLGSIITCLLMIAIGDNLARGIGIVGSLAIIRFRTNLRDPRDLVFLFAALGAGVACGVQSFIAATFGTLLFCAVAVIMQASQFGIRRKYDGLVRFQLPAGPAQAAQVAEIMQAIPRTFALVTLRDVSQGDLGAAHGGPGAAAGHPRPHLHEPRRHGGSVAMVKRSLFYAALLLAGLAAGYGYWAWQYDPYLVGTVESRMHRLGPREGGRVHEILVAVGSRVTPGQPLARLDVSDLAAERQVLEQQLDALEAALGADRRLLALEVDLLRLRLFQTSAAIQGDLAELRALDREIQILEEAEAAGLGRDRDLTRLRIERDALRTAAPEASARLPRRPPIHPGDDPAAGRDSVLAAPAADRMASLHEIRRRLTLIDQRLEYRTVRSPCEGLVVALAVREGATVDAYLPIVTVQDPEVRFVEAFGPETQDRPVEVGQSVEVYSRRSDRHNTTGHIRFVHPGFAPMPERLWLRGQVLWARTLEVELAPHHELLPGESVRVRILQGSRGDAVSGP